MEKNYLDYVNELKDRKVEEVDINSILKIDANYTSELGIIAKTIEDLSSFDELFNSIDNIVAFYMEKSIIFFNMINGYTTLKVNDGEDVVDNYNMILEEALKKNCFVQRFYDAIKEIREKERVNAVKELAIALKQIPNQEEIERMTNDFSKMFSEDNKENLELLENIVSFNDPSMKALKEAVYDSATDVLIKAEDINRAQETKK